MKKILVVGSSNVDFVIDTPHIPAPGETVLGGRLVKYPGGKGANQANAAGRLGGEVVFLTVLGEDEEGRMLRQGLTQAGVGMDRAGTAPDLATGIASIYVAEEGENAIVVAPGANRRCGRAYLEEQEEAFAECGLLLLSMEIPLEGVDYAARKGKERGKLVILNPAPAPAPDSLSPSLWKQVDLLTPNETELGKLSGMPVETLPQMEAACHALLEKGAGCLVVTLGEKGALLVKKGKTALFPAPAVTAVDTTGAGDTFNGALAVMLAKGAGLEEAVSFANCAAALSVTRRGAQTSAPAFDEVNALWQAETAGRTN